MFKQFSTKIVLLILITYLTSCSFRSKTNDAGTEDLLPSPTKTVVADQTITDIIPMPTATPTPISTFAATSEVIATVITSATPNIESLQLNCPIYTQNPSPLWSQGSILFSLGKIIDELRPDLTYPQLGIWAISANNLAPHSINASSTGVWISPDGTILLDVIRDPQNAVQEAVFYNVVENQEETSLIVPYDYWFTRWLQNGQVQFETIVERTENIGETRNTYILDPLAHEADSFEEKLYLPNFAFNDSELDRGNFFGYESIDPTGRIILYTAHKNSGNDFEVRLLNLETGTILWQHDTQYLPDALPQWSEDGSHVLFVVSIPAANTQQRWWKIINLTREGKEVELPSQPFPLIEEGQLNHFSRSPNGQYLFYTAFEVDSDNLTSRNRAFIVNVETGEIGEVCDPETTFIASVPARDVAGHWFLGDQFVYRVLIDKEGQPTHSLRVLDIPSWTTQTIFEAEAGYGINVFGWTAVEFP